MDGMIIAGIEEAGRGPVIGPMVMCGVTIDSSNEEKLRAIGVKDSKLLSPRQREALVERIIGMTLSHHIVVLSPQEVDAAVTSKAMNLNWLEAEISARILTLLKPEKAILDCPSNNIKAYEMEVRRRLGGVPMQIIAEHKADVNYPIVSASSILAKVRRDEEIEKIKKIIGIDFGSGYPADPRTSHFLRQYWNKYPYIFRHSWSSYKQYSGGGEGQISLGGFSAK